MLRNTTYHYRDLSTDPEMVSSYVLSLPASYTSEFPNNSKDFETDVRAFPEKCPRCSATELLFSRIEEYKQFEEEEIINVYKIHHVYCFKCTKQGKLEYFQVS